MTPTLRNLPASPHLLSLLFSTPRSPRLFMPHRPMAQTNLVHLQEVAIYAIARNRVTGAARGERARCERGAGGRFPHWVGCETAGRPASCPLAGGEIWGIGGSVEKPSIKGAARLWECWMCSDMVKSLFFFFFPSSVLAWLGPCSHNPKKNTLRIHVLSNPNSE